MLSKNHHIPPAFDAERWQWSYDETQEKLLIELNNLTRSYLQLQQEYAKAPAHLKPAIKQRLQSLENLIVIIDECTSIGREFIASVVTSLFVEYEHLRTIQVLKYQQ
jgi:hypothetical protein